MRKFGVFTVTIFLSILIAGIYGILHDQVTYSISPEYFTKFKYRQFSFTADDFGGHRQTVAAIGFLATWWMGVWIGLVLAFVGLLFPDYTSMKKAIRTALVLIFSITFLFGIAGFLYGRYYLVHKGVNWWMPPDLIDKNNFIITGSIHNYSYTGGIAGLLLAVIYMIIKNYRSKKKTTS